MGNQAGLPELQEPGASPSGFSGPKLFWQLSKLALAAYGEVMKSWYFTCVWKLVAFQVMMSGPSDLFTGSGCEASRKKNRKKTQAE